MGTRVIARTPRRCRAGGLRDDDDRLTGVALVHRAACGHAATTAGWLAAESGSRPVVNRESGGDGDVGEPAEPVGARRERSSETAEPPGSRVSVRFDEGTDAQERLHARPHVPGGDARS